MFTLTAHLVDLAADDMQTRTILCADLDAAYAAVRDLVAQTGAHYSDFDVCEDNDNTATANVVGNNILGV